MHVSQIAAVAAGLLDLFAPLRCPLCGLALVDRRRCPPCALPDPGSVRRRLCADDRGEFLILAGGIFAGRLREVVHAFKYQQDPGALRLLSAQAAMALPPDLHWQALVPVPTHRVRARERGWGAVGGLAVRISALLDIPVAAALDRNRYTPALTGHGVLARRKILRGALRARPVGGHLLLVDDVYTTGATYQACRRKLLEAGAQSVDLLVIARTPPRVGC